MEWVASTLHTTSEHGVSSIPTTDAHTSDVVVDWTDAPADLNGIVRFAERRNLVSVRVPSHFKRSLLLVLVNNNNNSLRHTKTGEVIADDSEFTIEVSD
jgi:hypothetical protein